jgi:hypothetical protein
MSTTPHASNGTHQPSALPITTVRYSLPEMLNELKLERGAASFTMEKLHQSDIGKLFQGQSQNQPKKRRVKSA